MKSPWSIVATSLIAVWVVCAPILHAQPAGEVRSPPPEEDTYAGPQPGTTPAPEPERSGPGDGVTAPPEGPLGLGNQAAIGKVNQILKDTALGLKIAHWAMQTRWAYGNPGSFGYDPSTNQGEAGCAQMVSWVLKKAGVFKGTYLSVESLVKRLQKLKWKQIPCGKGVPPYRNGDVIVWRTGTKPNGQPQFHVGVIVMNGNHAMSNSSMGKHPRLTSMNYQQEMYVLRKG